MPLVKRQSGTSAILHAKGTDGGTLCNLRWPVCDAGTGEPTCGLCLASLRVSCP